MLYRLCTLLLSKNITVSTAESCTGGGISSRLVTYPGISEVFLGGIVAYGNQAKEQLLGVSAEVLDHYGLRLARNAQRLWHAAQENVPAVWSRFRLQGLRVPEEAAKQRLWGLCISEFRQNSQHMCGVFCLQGRGRKLRDRQ